MQLESHWVSPRFVWLSFLAKEISMPVLMPAWGMELKMLLIGKSSRVCDIRSVILDKGGSEDLGCMVPRGACVNIRQSN